MASITFVIPTHNEEQNIPLVFSAISQTMQGLPDDTWNVLFVDDGSTDATLRVLTDLAAQEPRVSYLEFSRNFGKEIATTAGLHAAHDGGCDAVILMDADLQHPPTSIPTFITHWQNGADMVVGLRKKNTNEGFIKKYGSLAFNKIMTAISETEYVPHVTDFRLISRPVLVAFRSFTERGRITRGLLDWLGFRKAYVEFEAPERAHGVASYSPIKLLRLALSSFLSMSFFPLRIAGYLGLLITIIAGPILGFMLLDRYILRDPFGLNFSGPAILAVLNLTLIGIVLSCLGLVALYVETIHTETMNRPLYIVRSRK